MNALIENNTVRDIKRQPKILKALTRVEFKSENETEFLGKESGDTRYGICKKKNKIKYIGSGTHIKFKSGTFFKINADMKCRTQNLIYCITYPISRENYIGKIQ